LLSWDTRPRDTPAGRITWFGDHPPLEAGLSARRNVLPIITAVHPGREAGDARQRSLWHGLADAHGEG